MSDQPITQRMMWASVHSLNFSTIDRAVGVYVCNFEVKLLTPSTCFCINNLQNN